MLKPPDEVPCVENRKRTQIIDIIKYTLKRKQKRTGCIARMKDTRWIKHCSEWQLRRGERSRAGEIVRRHSKEGRNHLEQESNRLKTMEGTDRGLHPAVDGQSLGEK